MQWISQGLILITMIFMLIGAIDHILGNRLGYGESFVEGINTCGPFILGAAIMMAIAPYLATLLLPYLTVLANLFHCDLSVFPSLILCSDMGGYAISIEVAENEAIGLYNGLVIASIIGATFTFIVPMALALLPKEDHSILASGVLTGMITAPVGCFISGIMMNLTIYHLSIQQIVINLCPIILISIVIVILLFYFPDQTIRIFGIIGRGISILITLLTALAIFQLITHIHIPYLDYPVIEDSTGYSPFEKSFVTCGTIAVVLSGAFPMVQWIMKVFSKPLDHLCALLEVDHHTIEGLLSSSTNHIAGLNTFSLMDTKGKYYTMSFMISGGCVIGDLLGFVAGINPDLLIPMITGKLIAGMMALLLAKKLYSYLL